MKSKKSLFTLMSEVQPERFSTAPAEGLKHEFIGDETFGNESFIFLSVLPNTRKRVELILKHQGYKVDKEYSPSSDTIEVQVSYFKGWHWNE